MDIRTNSQVIQGTKITQDTIFEKKKKLRSLTHTALKRLSMQSLRPAQLFIKLDEPCISTAAVCIYRGAGALETFVPGS